MSKGRAHALRLARDGAAGEQQRSTASHSTARHGQQEVQRPPLAALPFQDGATACRNTAQQQQQEGTSLTAGGAALSGWSTAGHNTAQHGQQEARRSPLSVQFFEDGAAAVARQGLLQRLSEEAQLKGALVPGEGQQRLSDGMRKTHVPRRLDETMQYGT